MATRLKCAEQLQEDVLSNHVILCHIFSGLSLQDLLTCRQVGKFWKCEASEFIREFRICYIFLRPGYCCSQLQQLDTSIHALTDLPFNGFKVSEEFSRLRCPNVSSGLENILQSIPLYHAFIPQSLYRFKEKCTVVPLFSKILTEMNENLQSVTFSDSSFSSSLGKDIECIQKLPRINQIEFVGSMDQQSINLLCALVKKCPNLRSIRGQINMELLQALEPSKRHLVKELVVEDTITAETHKSQLLPAFFPLKRLTIGWIHSEDQAGLLASLLKTLVASCASTLEVLELRSLPPPLLQLLPNFPPCPCLSRLTTIYMGGQEDTVLRQKQWLKRIFQIAPNLHQLRGAVTPQILGEVIPAEMQRYIKSFTLRIMNADEERMCADLANSAPQLESLEIYTCKGPEFYSSLVNILEKLLESSQCSLTYCYMNVGEGLPLAELRMPCMRGLKKIRILTANMTRGFVRGLESVNYQACLPSLLELQLYATSPPDTSDSLALDHAPVLSSCQSYESLTVTILRLDLDSRIHLKEIEAIFPNVIDLHIGWETPLGTPTPYEQVWTSWPALEVLEVHFRRRSGEEGFNYDHSFCGIHPEEAAELRKRKVLWGLEIVPIRAAVTNMKNLKSIHLNFYTPQELRGSTFGPGMLSNVPDWIALGQMPGLKISAVY